MDHQRILSPREVPGTPRILVPPRVLVPPRILGSHRVLGLHRILVLHGVLGPGSSFSGMPMIESIFTA